VARLSHRPASAATWIDLATTACLVLCGPGGEPEGACATLDRALLSAKAAAVLKPSAPTAWWTVAAVALRLALATRGERADDRGRPAHVARAETGEALSLAQHACIRALQQDPQEGCGWQLLGAAYWISGQASLAHAAFAEAQARVPADPSAWLGHAFIALHVGSSEALDLLRHAASLASRHAVGGGGLGSERLTGASLGLAAASAFAHEAYVALCVRMAPGGGGGGGGGGSGAHAADGTQELLEDALAAATAVVAHRPDAAQVWCGVARSASRPGVRC
jgi:hypothetical protein